MIGCRVKQTCTACAEQAAEAGRNGKGGTGFESWQARTEGEWSSGDQAKAWGPKRAICSPSGLGRVDPVRGEQVQPFAGSGRTQRMSLEGLL